MMALKVTLPPETRPGVRVDQATARLTRAQKLKAELEEKLLEVEQAVQDNLTEIAAATAELPWLSLYLASRSSPSLLITASL